MAAVNKHKLVWSLSLIVSRDYLAQNPNECILDPSQGVLNHEITFPIWESNCVLVSRGEGFFGRLPFLALPSLAIRQIAG